MSKNKNQKFSLPTKKLKKDLGVPKLPALKTKHDPRKATQHARPRETDVTMAIDDSLASLAASAARANDVAMSLEVEGGNDSTTQARRQYIRSLHKVIEQSDVVILVLDARDPEGCRSKLVEDEVRRRESEGKKLVFVLNKIDLVSQENAMAWLKYLRHTAPTVPFRSSTQQQSHNLTSKSTPGLINLIKSYRTGPAGRITVGVVGYPNVGKSSLINSLKRSKVCAVGAEAGWTKELQSVQIDRGIRVIDSPGVVFDDVDEESVRARAGVLLRNVVKVDEIDDPLAVVEEIVKRTEKETLQRIYKLPDWNNMSEFITMVALSSGRLQKGGTPDPTAAARQILKDWNANKIPYFSIPPTVHPSQIPDANIPGAEDVGQAMIVTGGFGKAFDLGELYGAAMQEDGDDEMEADQEGGGVEEQQMNEDEMPMDDPVPIRPPSPEPNQSDLAPSMNPMSRQKRALTPSEADTSAPTRTTDSRPQKRLKPTKPTYEPTFDPHEREMMGIENPMGRKKLKVNAKKERKAARRAAKLSSEQGGGGMMIDDVGDAMAFTFTA